MRLKGISKQGLNRIAKSVKGGFGDENVFDQFEEPGEENVPPDYEADAEDLVMFIENDGDLYRQQTVPIYKNLARKMNNGTYDHELSVKLWMYLVDAGAKQYAPQLIEWNEWTHNPPWHQIFPKSMRLEAAQILADTWLQQWEDGEIDDVLDW